MAKVDATTGIYTRRFAKRRTWKVDDNLLAAILATINEEWTIADLGAGVGMYVHALLERGYNACGFDGIRDVGLLSNGHVIQADLTSTDFFRARQRCDISPSDVAICIEVGEHIPVEWQHNFIDNVACVPTKRLVMSWGTPGQRGTAHVNCRMPEWVAGQFARRGWMVNEDETHAVRVIAGRGWDKKLMVFDRC